MFKPRTIVQIAVETSYGWFQSAPCDSMATAHYYVAHLAAAVGCPLVEVIPDYVYRVGGLTYKLAERQLLTTRAVGRLRKALEE